MTSLVIVNGTLVAASTDLMAKQNEETALALSGVVRSIYLFHGPSVCCGVIANSIPENKDVRAMSTRRILTRIKGW